MIEIINEAITEVFAVLGVTLTYFLLGYITWKIVEATTNWEDGILSIFFWWMVVGVGIIYYLIQLFMAPIIIWKKRNEKYEYKERKRK